MRTSKQILWELEQLKAEVWDWSDYICIIIFTGGTLLLPILLLYLIDYSDSQKRKEGIRKLEIEYKYVSKMEIEERKKEAELRKKELEEEIMEIARNQLKRDGKIVFEEGIGWSEIIGVIKKNFNVLKDEFPGLKLTPFRLYIPKQEEAEEIFCPFCGGVLLPDSKFCSSCGAELD